MSAIADRIVERLARMPMNGIALRMEIGCASAEFDQEIRALEDGGRVMRANGKYRIVDAPAPAPKEDEAMAPRGEQECTGCGEPKPLSEFYAGQKRCKPCVLAQQKARKAEKRAAVQKEGGGSTRQPKSPAPARRSAAPAADSQAAEELAVIHTPRGFRLGPLVKSVGGLIQMPYHVDLSFEQFDELVEWRKGTKQ